VSSFTTELWESIVPIFQAILEHPFVRGLTDGSLPEPTFRFYVIQDSLYLREFARSLAIASAKSPRDAWCDMFADHARTALVVERSLHEGFFRDWGLTEEQVRGTPLAPTNLAYTSFLVRTAYAAPFEELLGAVLPCYWIYWEVGKQLLGRGSPEPLYQRWIETYGGEEFAAIVRAILSLTDRLGPELSERERERATARFVTTSRYEWMFWDMGYRQERWTL
jgi:thiaminase/transcriptional activator TenA